METVGRRGSCLGEETCVGRLMDGSYARSRGVGQGQEWEEISICRPPTPRYLLSRDGIGLGRRIDRVGGSTTESEVRGRVRQEVWT